MRAVLAISCIMLLSVGTARAQTFEGRAIAKDGDDLVIGGIDIRLFGIDAFELHRMCEADSKTYACGELAKQDLAKKVQGRNVHCEQRDYDAVHKRPVAVCSMDGEDLNAWMVSEGWAVAYRRFSNDYVDEEKKLRPRRKALGVAVLFLHGNGDRGRASLQRVRPSPWRSLKPVAASREISVRRGSGFITFLDKRTTQTSS
jgi:endonuclease YncB( thermonuclease family)